MELDIQNKQIDNRAVAEVVGISPNTMANELVINLLQMKNQYQIYHWQTFSYASHEAFGKIYDLLDDKIDALMESYMGQHGRPYTSMAFPIICFNFSSADSAVRMTNSYIDYMNQLFPSQVNWSNDLLNIRDEIVAALNKLKYLLSLN